MTVNHGTEPTGRVQAVDRAVALLEAVAKSRDAQTSQALADRCGLNRSTAWRLLLTLEHHGLVDRDDSTTRYRIGLGILRLAGAAGIEPLVRRARPAIRRVAEATGETANLAVPRGLEVVFADEVQSDGVISLQWLGRTAPLHATSTGKAFLAALPSDDVEAALNPPLEECTETTITDIAALHDELRQVRARGYAQCRGEFEPMLWGVSAVVLDALQRPVAVVGIWGAERRVCDRLGELSSACVATAQEISSRLAASEVQSELSERLEPAGRATG